LSAELWPPSFLPDIRISPGRTEEMRAFWRAWDMLQYPKNNMRH
jgi:hypothetical protein